ncbi:hypothetical protein BST61_g2147 [Cercospora zeina]
MLHELDPTVLHYGFGATHIPDLAWDIKEPKTATLASELDEKTWHHLLQTIKMLHGYVLDGTSEMSRAWFQAFQLKPPPGKTYTEASEIQPEFEVFNNSSISMKETRDQLEKSMAHNGFS